MLNIHVLRKGTGGGQQLVTAMNKLQKSQVYVGIPAAKTMRRGDVMNNASLMYIHTHGSPVNNIPPRPVIEPAIAGAQDLIAPELAAAAHEMFQVQTNQSGSSVDKAVSHLERAGIIASNAAKRMFGQSPPLEPNAPSTIARKGSDSPLIDTGQLRRAITYVVVAPDLKKQEDTRNRQGGEAQGTEGEPEAEAAESVAQAAEGVAGAAAEVGEGIAGVAEGAATLLL